MHNHRTVYFLLQWSLFIGLLAGSHLAIGQRPILPCPVDTVYVQAGCYVLIDQHAQQYLNDTVLCIPRYQFWKVSKTPFNSPEKIYQSVEKMAGKNRFTQELYRLGFRSPKNNAPPLNKKKGIPTSNTLENKTIRRIRILSNDPFGYSVKDTLTAPQTKIERWGNRLHHKTRAHILKPFVLFKEGDLVDNHLIRNSERIIRQLPYIDDARVILEPVNGHPEQVDVLVVTKDVWSMGIDVKVINPEKADLKIYESNILGMGHKMVHQADLKSNGDRILRYTHFGYEVPQSGRHHLGTNIQYKLSDQQESYRFQLHKSFIAENIPWAGGLLLDRSSDLAQPDNLWGYPSSITYFTQDLWLGANLGVFSPQDPFENYNEYLGFRVYHRQYDQRPEADSISAFFNKTLLLANFTLSKRRFYEGRLIYNLGRREDIPTGFYFTTTLGQELAENTSRVYAGADIRWSQLLQGAHYFYFRAATGSYFRNRETENGSVLIKTTYFSPILFSGRIKIRQFARIAYTNGIKRNDSKHLQLVGPNGIRGWNGETLSGIQKLSINLETVAFPPTNLYGFKFSILGFIDQGWIGPSSRVLKKMSYYAGLGLGLRIRNENLIFKSLQIRFAYYPIVPAGVSNTSFAIGGENQVDFDNLQTGAPATLPFY